MPSLASTTLALSLIAATLASDHVPLQPLSRSSRHRDLARSVPRAEAKRAANGLDADPVLGGFKIIGNSGVSAQMMFLGTENTVFILDSESYSLPINRHWESFD